MKYNAYHKTIQSYQADVLNVDGGDDNDQHLLWALSMLWLPLVIKMMIIIIDGDKEFVSIMSTCIQHIYKYFVSINPNSWASAMNCNKIYSCYYFNLQQIPMSSTHSNHFLVSRKSTEHKRHDTRQYAWQLKQDKDSVNKPNPAVDSSTLQDPRIWTSRQAC